MLLQKRLWPVSSVTSCSCSRSTSLTLKVVLFIWKWLCEGHHNFLCQTTDWPLPSVILDSNEKFFLTRRDFSLFWDRHSCKVAVRSQLHAFGWFTKVILENNVIAEFKPCSGSDHSWMLELKHELWVNRRTDQILGLHIGQTSRLYCFHYWNRTGRRRSSKTLPAWARSHWCKGYHSYGGWYAKYVCFIVIIVNLLNTFHRSLSMSWCEIHRWLLFSSFVLVFQLARLSQNQGQRTLKTMEVRLSAWLKHYISIPSIPPRYDARRGDCVHPHTYTLVFRFEKLFMVIIFLYKCVETTKFYGLHGILSTLSLGSY